MSTNVVWDRTRYNLLYLHNQVITILGKFWWTMSIICLFYNVDVHFVTSVELEVSFLKHRTLAASGGSKHANWLHVKLQHCMPMQGNWQVEWLQRIGTLRIKLSYQRQDSCISDRHFENYHHSSRIYACLWPLLAFQVYCKISFYRLSSNLWGLKRAVLMEQTDTVCTAV